MLFRSVGAELCPLLCRVGFRVTICDDRPDFARPERFPQAERVLLVDYRSLPLSLALTERDYVAVRRETFEDLAAREV